MEKQNFEKGASVLSEKEILEQKLVDANQKLQDMKERAGEFYDLSLYELFMKARKIDPNAMDLFLRASGSTPTEVMENLKKYHNFEDTQLKPIKSEIWDTKEKIRSIEDNKKKVEQDIKEREAAEAFKKEKGEVELKLYTALDEIHSQIPNEAKEVGMTIEAALKTYLPKLVHKAEEIESYISELEEIDGAHALSRLKERLEMRRIFSQ